MSEPDSRAEWWTAVDGLRLHCRVYEPAGAPDEVRTAVLCLPGLTRNSRDFEALAPQLARGGRRALCPDLRGRGLSDRDPDFMRYHPGTYLADLAALAARFGLRRFAVLGTSLGGILAMLLPTVLPGAVAGMVLNDVGPEIDPVGADRIRRYAGRLPAVQSWPEAVLQLKTLYATAWPDLSEDMWTKLAYRSYRADAAGVPVLDADPRIGDAMRTIPASTPDLWPLFATLGTMPILAIRGALSDILSAATLERMRREKPDLETLVIANRGHVPLLDEPEALCAIDRFLAALR